MIHLLVKLCPITCAVIHCMTSSDLFIFIFSHGNFQQHISASWWWFFFFFFKQLLACITSKSIWIRCVTFSTGYNGNQNVKDLQKGNTCFVWNVRIKTWAGLTRFLFLSFPWFWVTGSPAAWKPHESLIWALSDVDVRQLGCFYCSLLRPFCQPQSAFDCQRT